MRLPAVAAVVPLLLSLSAACKPEMRYGYSRDAHVTSEYVLVRNAESGERVEEHGIGPERLRMHLYDPFESNWPSSSRTFYVDLGPECRLMARADAYRQDTGQWSSQEFIQAEAHFVEGKRCSLRLDSGVTIAGTVKTGVMVIRPSTTNVDVALALDDGTLRVALSGPWQPPREGS
jgi:hypothetical protein